jgi:RNA polymerase sigma-70 factor, ECF subfamily
MVSPELLAACRRGETGAFEEVVRTTHRHVYTQALRLVGDRQDAEDVTQEAYARVFRGLSGFRGDAQFETWLYRIVSNAAMSFLRKRGRFGELVAENGSDRGPAEGTLDPPSGVQVAEQTVERDVLERALERLPLSLRFVVVLRDVYGFSAREVGDHLSISEGAVKVRLHRARRRLKEMLFDEEAGHDDV